MTEPGRIPQLDLRAQHASIAGEVEAAALEILRSQQCVLGAPVEAFEREVAAWIGVPHAIGCASGSDALLLALQALDVGPGDEVVTTPFTFFATVAAIVRLGATPVLADICPATFNLDPERARRVLTSRTRVILPVHLYGQSVDLDAFDAVAREAGASIVEDAAQAIGAAWDGRAAGTWGDIACFSFYPTKNLGAAGDGGLLTTRDDSLARRLGTLRVHGSARRYFHDEVGINSRLDGLQAAILRVKLRHLAAWTAARRERAATYDELLAGAGLAQTVQPPVVDPRATHVFHQYVVRAPRRDALRDHLAGAGIGTEVYYPLPLHLQECFRPLGYGEGDLPESERAAREVLALPLYPELTTDQQARVIREIARFYGAPA